MWHSVSAAGQLCRLQALLTVIVGQFRTTPRLTANSQYKRRWFEVTTDRTIYDHSSCTVIAVAYRAVLLLLKLRFRCPRNEGNGIVNIHTAADELLHTVYYRRWVSDNVSRYTIIGMIMVLAHQLVRNRAGGLSSHAVGHWWFSRIQWYSGIK